MLKMDECTHKNTCYDCGNTACYHHGKKEADCPKYGCYEDCEECEFINDYIEEERKEYGRKNL